VHGLSFSIDVSESYFHCDFSTGNRVQVNWMKNINPPGTTYFHISMEKMPELTPSFGPCINFFDCFGATTGL